MAGLSRREPRQVNAFLERTHEAVYCMTARLTFDPDLRHDWAQEILLKILAEMGEGRFVYRHPGCFWSWFQQRCHFLLINTYSRHRRREEPVTAGEVGEELVERLALAPGADPSRLVEDAEAREVIERCLAALDSADQRDALEQVLLQGEPYQAVVERSGAALNTVRSWVRRGRIALRRCVARAYGLEWEAEKN